MLTIKIDLHAVINMNSFHDVFARTLGFPSFYGRNMHAWIDCMSSIDAPDDGMSTVHVEPSGTLVLHLLGAMDLKQRCRDVYDELVECTAHVNNRRINAGEGPLLALAFD